MPTPTEEGWYWWTNPPNASTVVSLWRGPRWCSFPRHSQVEIVDKAVEAGRLERVSETIWLLSISGGDTLEADAYPEATWGERIPDNPRLKAMKRMAEMDPTIGRYEGHCPFCLADVKDGNPEDHYPDCPWRRAQEE